MPAINDVVRAVVSYNNPVGGIAQNTFTFLLTSVATALWSEVADDIEAYLLDALSDWFENVETGIASQNINLLLRDPVAGQWDSVLERSWTDLVGSGVGDTSVSFSSPKMILYPGSIRHWGFKNLMPPVETEVTNGSLDAIAFADLVLTTAKLGLPLTGTFISASHGVYSLADELFRGFTGQGVASTALGSRVTRKEGVGI